MPKIPGINHLRAVKALEKAGFRIVRQGKKHIVMSDDTRFLTIPRSNPVNAYTIIADRVLRYECSFAVSIVAFIKIDFTVIFSTSELTGGDAAQRNRRPVERLGHLT